MATDLTTLVNVLQQQNQILTNTLRTLQGGIVVLPQPYASVQATPGAPTGTSSTTAVMMGLAAALTPVVSGRVLIVVSGTIYNASAIADGGKVQLYYGTGTAPANAASLTGTAVGSQPVYIAATTAEKAPFSVQSVVTGLVLGTAIWIDLSLAAITGGTANVANLSVSAIEY